jgi:hypothetical protein
MKQDECDLEKNFDLKKGRVRDYGKLDLVISEVGDLKEKRVKPHKYAP